MKTLSLIAGFLLVVNFNLYAQPANDDFDSAALVIGTLATGSNIGATTEPGEPLDVERPGFPRSPLGGHSVWWRWTAPASGLFTIKTGDRSGAEPSSNFDTQLAVYAGTSLNDLVEVASNEDHIQFPNGLSSVTIDAIEGTTYHILVDGFGGETGTIVLYIVPTRFPLSVFINPINAGTVLLDPPYEPDGYLAGTVVTLQPVPFDDEQFYGWTGGLNTTSNVISVVMNSNMTLTAMFAADSQFIWQNTNGQIAVWTMLNTNLISSAIIASLPDVWRLSAVADLDNSGSGDFIFRRRDGRVSAWMMDGDVRTNNFHIGDATNGFRLVGAGHFNEDSEPDLLFQRTNGVLRVWFMNELSRTNMVNVGKVHPDWRAITVADFNRDGYADIFFQHRDGRVAVWHMQGTQRIDSVLLGKTGSKLAAVHDLTNDGHLDLIFRKEGVTAAWLMNETVRESAIVIRRGLPQSAQWRLVGVRTAGE